jgi:hypothetical protein
MSASMQNMSKQSCCSALVLVIALWWAAPLPVYAIPFTPAVEYATSSALSFNPGFGFTLGYQFSMSGPFTVDALAYFNDGLGNDHSVQLWNSTGGNVIQTTVTASDPVQGHFQYTSFTPIPLPAGVYTIGGFHVGGSGTIPFDAAGVVTVPGYTWIKDVHANGAFTYPTISDCFGSCGQNPWLAVTFSIVPAVAVPESSTVLLLATGLAGILGYGWRRKRTA